MNAIKKCIAEMIGTFYLCFPGIAAILCTQSPIMRNVDPAAAMVMIALAHGLGLSIAVATFGGVSGAHVDPAVTCGMLVTGRIHPLLALGYIAFQLLGASLAAMVCMMVFPAAAVDNAKLGIPLPPLDAAWAVEPKTILIVEAICTFLLVTSVFGAAVDERGKGVKVGGFAIGLTVAFDILAAGKITGASMNPARSFGPALVYQFWDMHWMYWAGPIAGGVLAALLYQHLLLKEDVPKKAA